MWDQPHAVMTALYEFLGVVEPPRLPGARERREAPTSEPPSVPGPLI
jgi:hypothetical protein